MKRCLLIGTLVLGWIACYAGYTPQSVPRRWMEGKSRFVTNPDGLLSVEEERALVSLSEQVWRETGVEMATVALQSIDNADAFDFSVKLFNLWGIGNEQNQGTLILLVQDSRDIQIRTGGGVEGLLPDAVCEQIRQEDMIPLLRENAYGEGLLAGNRAIAKHVTTDAAKAELLLGYKPKEVTTMPWSGLSIACLLFIAFLIFSFYSKTRCPQCGKRLTKRKDTLISRPTYTASGRGVHNYTCECCGYTWAVPYTIARLIQASSSAGGWGGSSRGGFSGGGFGGGMTFGGGAGGKF